jgi:hypothetical protein
VNPKIGIVSSAHRPQNWMNLYRSIGENNIDYELVFVGPNSPDYELPKNFRFIRSIVKPTQCFEIAVRNTTADLILPVADDCEFNTPQPLDKLYDFYKSCSCDKIIVSSRMMTDGEDQSHFAHRFFTHDDNSPIMPICGLMSRKYFSELGGIDRNFIGIMWDLDLAMRVHASGGKVVLGNVYINEDTNKGSSLCGDFWEHDRMLLESLWTTNGKVHFNRKNPVEPFSDINILTASQGPRGRWRGNGPLFYEKIEDRCRSIFGYRSIIGRLSRGIKKPSMYLYYLKRMVLSLQKKRLPNIH